MKFPGLGLDEIDDAPVPSLRGGAEPGRLATGASPRPLSLFSGF